jgi:hypothetical protein
MVGTLESQYRWSGAGRGGVSVYSPTRRVQARRNAAPQPQSNTGVPFQIHAPAGTNGLDLGRRIEMGTAAAPPSGGGGAQQHEGGWRGLLGSVVNNPIGKAVLMPLNILDIPRRLVVSSVKEIGDVFAGGASMSDWWSQVKDPNFGVGSFLHIDGPNNLFNRWANRLIGFAGDVALDPLTYIGGASAVTGASRRARLTMGALASGIEGISPEVARIISRRGIGTLDDATRAILREGGVAVKDAGYYFRLPLAMGEHARIPGTAGIDRLMSATTGRILPAASNATIGNILGHWSADESLQGAARRMLTGEGAQSFQSAAATYLYAMEHKQAGRTAEKVGASDINGLLKVHGDETLNAAVRESEATGTGPVAEFFQRARVRNDQSGVRHGIITSQVNGKTTATYAPHYQTPEFQQLLNGGEPMSAALKKALGSGATVDDISQSAQRRMLVPRPEPYDILGKEMHITTGTIDEFNSEVARLFPDFKGKALYDDFRTIATKYNVGMARDIAKVAGVRKVRSTGLIRTGVDADPLVTKAVNEVASRHANADELKRIRALDRVKGKAVSNLRTDLSKQYAQITGQLGDDLHKIVDELQTLPPELQARIKSNLIDKQAEAGAATATTNEAVRTATPAPKTEVTPELMTSIDEAITDVDKKISKRKKRIDELAPVAAAEIEKMNVAMASNDPEQMLAAATTGVPAKQEWDSLVNDQMAATIDRQALVEMEARLGEHTANYNRLVAARSDNALLDLFESHLAAEAHTVTIGDTRVLEKRLAPAEPGETRWHIAAHKTAEGEFVPARDLRARVGEVKGAPNKFSWEVRKEHLQTGLADIISGLPDDSEVKRWGGVVLAKAQKLNREEQALYDAATTHAAAIDRAKGQLVNKRREEQSLSTAIEALEGRPSKRTQLYDKVEERRALREGSLAEATKAYENAQSVVAEAEARHKSALVDYNQSVKQLLDVATSEDRRAAERRLIGDISNPETRAAAAQRAAGIVEEAEARYGGKITEARAELATREAEVDRAVTKTAYAEEALADARRKQAEFGSSPRERRRRRLAGEAETANIWDKRVADAESAVTSARFAERKARQAHGAVTDTIADLRDRLEKARLRADVEHNPLARHGYTLDKAQREVADLKDQLEAVTGRVEQTMAQMGDAMRRQDEAGRQAQEITAAFAEIENSPRTYAAQREGSRQRRALEERAAVHGRSVEEYRQTVQFAQQKANEIEAKLLEAQGRVDRLSGALINRQQPIQNGLSDKLKALIDTEEARQKIAESPNRVKVHWEPVPMIPVRGALPAPSEAAAKLAAEVVGQGGPIRPDALRRIDATDFPELQRNALTSSPFGKGGQQDLVTRAKESVTNSQALTTEHASRLLEPGPNGLAAVSKQYLDGHMEMSANLSHALKAYGENATTGNLTRLEQLTADVTRSNAYLAVYKEALATGVEPGPEIGALILEQVMLREHASKKAQRAILAQGLTPEGYAAKVADFTAKAEASMNAFLDAYQERQQMMTWRDLSDPRFDEEELQKLRSKVSRTARARGKYYDREGNLRVPAGDPVVDTADLDYLTDVVEKHLLSVDEAEGKVSLARSGTGAMTAHERTAELEASIDGSMRRASNVSQDLSELWDNIQLAEEVGVDTVQIPKMRVPDRREISIAEAEQMLRETDLSPELRDKITKSLTKARSALAKQNASDAKWLTNELTRERNAAFSASQAEAALERGEAGEAAFRLRESERYGENAQVNEAVKEQRRAAQEIRETRVYSMTPEGERGELKKVIDPAAARQNYLNTVAGKDRTKVSYTVWEHGVEVDELPIAEARAMHDRMQLELRKDTAEMTQRQLEHDVLTGDADHQMNYIRQIMADNRQLRDPEEIEAEATAILEQSRAAGRDLTDEETQDVALLQARAAVRRMHGENGLPIDVRTELLQRGAAIKRTQRNVFERYDIRGAHMLQTADALRTDVMRILDKQGDLTLEDIQTLATALPSGPEQGRAVDALRKTLNALEEQMTQAGRSGSMRGKTVGPELLSDFQIDDFRNRFAHFYGDDGANLFLKDIQEEIDANMGLTPMGVSEEGVEFGDQGVTAARGRMRDNVLARARMSRDEAIEDMRNVLQVAGLKAPSGNKTVSYYRDPREAIRKQLESRGVKTSYVTSERLAEMDARISTLELILRSLGNPTGEATIGDYVDVIARAQRADPESTIGQMLRDVHDQMRVRPDEAMDSSKAFRRDLRAQVKAARAAGDTERATRLSKMLVEIDQKARVFDRNPAPEEFIPPALDNPSPEALNAPDLPTLQRAAEAATQRRTQLEQDLATAQGVRDQAAQAAPPVDQTTVLTEQLNTLDYRLARMRDYHETQPKLRASDISPTESEMAQLELQYWGLKAQLEPLTSEERAASDKAINDLAAGPLGMRQKVRPTREQQAEIDRIKGSFPPDGRALEGDPGTLPSSGAPAHMDDSVRDLERRLEAAKRDEQHAATQLSDAQSAADGSADPSMVDNEAAAASAEGTPAPMVDQASGTAPAPSPDAAVPPPTTAKPELQPITDPDLQAVQQEYDIAVSEYQNTVAKYGSYEAADETGKEAIGLAADRVRKLDGMRQSMRRDAEVNIMRGDTALAYKLDQEARKAQQAAVEARNITSDPEYILLHGTPSQKMLSDYARNYVPPRSTYYNQAAQVGRFEDAGRARAIGGRGVRGELVPSRTTYYDEARRRLDNLIDTHAAARDELQQQMDALGVVRSQVGDTPEVLARDSELRAQHEALLQADGVNSEARASGLARKQAEEADVTQQLRDVGAVPLVHAREELEGLMTREGKSRLDAELTQTIMDAREMAESAEMNVEETLSELEALIERTSAPSPLVSEPPATNPVAPRGPLDYTDEERAAALAANAPTQPPQPAPPLFETPAAPAPPVVPAAAGGAPPATPPPPVAGGAPTPPPTPARKAKPKPTKLPPKPNAKTGSASEWQSVFNDLNDVNEARRVLGTSNEDVNKTAALLVAAAKSAKDLAQAQIDYDLIHKRLADFRQGSEKVADTLRDVAADGWRMLTWSTMPEGERWVIAEELGKSLDNFHKAISLPDTWNLLDHYTRFFKTYATGRPGFHVRNAMSSMFMNLVAGVRLHAMSDSISLWRQFEKAPYEFLSGLNPDSLEFKAFSAVFGSGAAGAFEDVAARYGETIPGKVWKKVIDNRYTRWNQRMGARVEGSIRLGMALDSMRRGQDTISAMSRIAKYHFDYTEMSRLDRQARRLIPFWTFLSRNLPLQVEQMWARPRVYLQYRSLVRNFGETPDPLTPQYWLDAGAFTMDDQAADDQINAGPSWLAQLDLPFQTATEPLQAAAEGNFGKAILSDINPAIISPLEAFGFNRKLFTGAPLEEGQYSAPNPAQEWMMPILRVLGGTSENARGEEVIDDRYAHVARTLNPIQDLAERITDTSGTRSDRQDETMMRYLGIPVRKLTPEVRQSTRTTAYYDRVDEARRRRRTASAGTRN